MNPLYESITKISRDVVSQYKLPVWGVIQSRVGKNATVLVQEPGTGSTVILKSVPIMLGGKSIKDSELEANDLVQVAFEGGDLGHPTIIGVAPVEQKDTNRKFSNYFTLF